MQKLSSQINLYFFSFLSVIIVYGFALTNFSVVPDTESPIFKDYSLVHGRWGTNLIRYHIFEGLFPYYTLLLGLFFLSIASIETVKVLNIKGLYRYVFILLFLSYPQHAYQLAFTMQADAIGIGYFTSILAVSIFVNLDTEKKIYATLKIIFIVILLIFSIAIYQALIFIPIILYSLYFFTQIDSENNKNLMKEWKKLFQFIGVLLIASLIYLVSVKMIGITNKTEYLSSYTKGENSNNITNFLKLLFENLKGKFYYGNQPYILVSIGFLISFTIFLFEKNRIILKSFVYLFLLIFPFFISFFINNGDHPPRLYMGSTIVFAFVIVYLLSKINVKYSLQILFFTVIIFLWNTYFVSNLFYVSNKIYHHDLNIARNINNYIVENINDFNSKEDYVYFYGKTSQKEYENLVLPKSDIFSGSLFRWDEGNNWRIINFFRFTDLAYYRFLDNKNEFVNFIDSIPKMPIYPSEGSIKKINNTVIVKLGFSKGALLPFENEVNIVKTQKKKLKIENFSTLIYEDSKIIGGVDQFSQDVNKVLISGWVAYEKVPSETTETSLILYSKAQSFLVETNIAERKDVTDYLGDGTDYNSSGYIADFDVSHLPKGTYEVRLRVKQLNSNIEGYKLGYKTIEVK